MRPTIDLVSWTAISRLDMTSMAAEAENTSLVLKAESSRGPVDSIDRPDIERRLSRGSGDSSTHDCSSLDARCVRRDIG